MMNSAICEILDIESEPPTFLLTPEEFAEAVDVLSGQQASHEDFINMLVVKVCKKTGRSPDRSKWKVQQQLAELRLQDAPDYIKQSDLKTEEKLALLGSLGHYDEADLKELASWDRIPKRGQETLSSSVNSALYGIKNRREELAKFKAKLDQCTPENIAEVTVEDIGLYTAAEPDLKKQFKGILLQLKKPELLAVHELVRQQRLYESFINVLRKMM